MNLPHYEVNEAIFIDFEDALNYCDNQGISYELIIKKYHFTK